MYIAFIDLHLLGFQLKRPLYLPYIRLHRNNENEKGFVFALHRPSSQENENAFVFVLHRPALSVEEVAVFQLQAADTHTVLEPFTLITQLVQRNVEISG